MDARLRGHGEVGEAISLLLCFFLFILCGLLFASRPALADPFTGNNATGQGNVAMAFFSTPFLQEILQVQKQIHEAMTDAIIAVKNQHDLMPLWGLLLFSFAYGVFHVLAPGHGKVIVSTYFLGNHAKWRDGVWAGLVMAIGHTITAVGIVVVLYLVLGLGQFKVLAHARYVELAGYAMIAGIGIWLFMRALKNEPECLACAAEEAHAPGHEHHDHGHVHEHAHEHKHESGTRLFAATSLVPCTGSMIILLFTMTHEVLWAGVLAVIAIALGMWLTITGIGFASMLLRRVLVGKDGGNKSGFNAGARKVLRMLAACVVMATGSLLFLGTLAAMMAG